MTLSEYAKKINELVARDSRYKNVQLDCGLLFCKAGKGEFDTLRAEIIDKQSNYNVNEIQCFLENCDFENCLIDKTTKSVLVIKSWPATSGEEEIEKGEK